jgi:predicted CoA-binding protein
VDAIMSFSNPDDDTLRRLFKNSRTIAVVGLSPDPERPSHSVSLAMQHNGYRIVPINPSGGTILGEKAYPNLTAIPVDIRVDIVDVFRRSDAVVPIAQEAVKIGARALWLQQGVVNEEAAVIADKAGLICVMDRCIEVAHSALKP